MIPINASCVHGEDVEVRVNDGYHFLTPEEQTQTLSLVLHAAQVLLEDANCVDGCAAFHRAACLEQDKPVDF
jgi:hypothetical protein